jgi:hypothetical protein
MIEKENMDDVLSHVFSSGKVFSASDEDLNRYLQHLASGYVPNEMVRHREMNRCQIINTIKTFRLIDGLDKKNEELQKTNKFLTYVVIILAVVSVALAVMSYWQARDLAKESGAQLDRWIDIQKSSQQKLLELQEKQVKLMEKLSAPNTRLKGDAQKPRSSGQSP